MKTNIAFISFGISDITGGGGAERFFADFFDYYTNHGKNFNLFWIIDQESKTALRKANKLVSKKNQIRLRIFSNRYKIVLENLQILTAILFYRIKLIHIPLYNLHYYPLLIFIQNLPGLIKPKLTVNIIDCSLPFCFKDTNSPRHIAVTSNFESLFNTIKVNGYLAWNKSFVTFAKEPGRIMHSPVLYSITSRFCDTRKYSPARIKKKRIIFASRLAVFKNVDWFIESVNYLRNNYPDFIEGWQFTICGDGPLKESLLLMVQNYGLGNKIEFIVEPNMEIVLNESMCFVSCQDYDNFPSMSMAEAMASGNVIVSRNVGQTALFVHHEKNGFLAEVDTVEGVAMAILNFLKNTNRFKEMSEYGVNLMKEVHTPQNFIPQIEDFWLAVKHSL